MKKRINWILYIIFIIYLFFIIGSPKSPSPFRDNIVLHIIFITILLFLIILKIYFYYINKKETKNDLMKCGNDVKKKENKKWLGALILNPLTIIIYGIGCYYINELCKYGGVRRRLPVVIICIGIIVIWYIICLIIHKHKEKQEKMQEPFNKFNDNLDARYKIYKIWVVIAILLFVTITAITGYGIYQSAIKYNGKLSWVIENVKNKRTIEFEHNNIYKDGIDGILQDIGQKEELPEELYISSEFSLDFAADGTILEFDAFLYGKNEDGKTKSFLISYDSNKTDRIIVYMNGWVTDSYEVSKSLSPLLEMIKVIPLKDTVMSWNAREYSILYQGVRNWGYNTEGIIYIDEDGKTIQINSVSSEIKGYTVSVYVEGKEELMIPQRYIALWENAPETFEEETKTEVELRIIADTVFEFSDTKMFRLLVVDAAAGSRFYSLNESNDGGATWQLINQDPFLGNSGVAAGICFIDEKIGFICLAHSGGSYGELYRTEDGGVTFQVVEIPEVKVALNETESYNPFDLPKVPTKKGEVLQLLVTQGQDGDYNAGCMALYQSKDNGVSWEYLKEVIEE